MSARRFALLAAALTLFAPAGLRAQTGLRDLLTNFLQEGITLAPPASGVSHVAHFNSLDSLQFISIRQFNQELANQLSSFPLASSAGGFTYRFDPALGVFTRATDSFGPIYADRADTIGKGKFNLGLNYSHFDFDRINELSLGDGDLRLVFTHADVNHDGSNLHRYVEGDVITGQLFLKIKTDITAFVLTYGVSNRFDIGMAIPVVHVDLSARTDATIQRLATGPTDNPPTIHRFPSGGSTATFQDSGNASGVGDIVLRGKFRVVGGAAGGLALGADVRLPTGEERDLLGTGATQARVSLSGSLNLGNFAPHINGGYTKSAKPQDDRTPEEKNPPNGGTPLPRLSIPDAIDYTAGFDWAVHPRVTVALDVLGRTFRQTQIVRVVKTNFQANTNKNEYPETIVAYTFPRLTSTKGNSNTLLGSFGLKVNPFANLLVTGNVLFSLRREGLQTRIAPLVGVDYSF
ncbi:MAG TPA: hypothetical protein VLO07_07230 [Thermoanaerobaculia bacterium]|nr:hypothetical protein [Thermoanaerobaculia bacterium]